MIAAVVLAAGASSRYGADPPKQQELLPRVLAAVRASAAIGEVVVVTGAHEVDTDARTVACPDWARGPGASLRCGLATLGDDVEAAVVVLADGPNLEPRAVDRVVAAWRYDGGDVYACAYAGVRLHPVLLARAAWALVPDSGAKSLEARLVECDDLNAPGDVDVKPQA